jgi:cytochrome c oxidase accessory protein FixG
MTDHEINSSEGINEHAGKLVTETGSSFRDSSSQIDKKGKRVWIYPTKPSGKFHKARLLVGYFLLISFFVLPHIKVNGEPFFLFDIFNRKFVIFGSIFWPHDFYIFALVLLSLAVFIVLFTAIFGRIFCGWICPQLVIMELVFRKVEYFIEGDASKQRALNKEHLNQKKFFKKFSKQSIFLILAFLINATFLSYIFSMDTVLMILSGHPGDNIGKLISLIVFTFLFYGNYAWFREQACTYVCPYGRIQSALIDKNSIIVAYDNVRGEPRGKMSHGNIQEGNGSCIDCGNCVRVCPTGIDIRNGIQLECVGCTNCIDSCDSIMDSIKQPRGLIRYASLNNIENGTKFKITPRLIFYMAVLTVLLTVVTVLLANRSEVQANILRARGSTFFVKENGNIVNIFTMKLMNKTFKEKLLTLKTENYHGVITFAGNDKLLLKPDAILEGTFLIEIPKEELKASKSSVIIGIYEGDKRLDKFTTTFSKR